MVERADPNALSGYPLELSRYRRSLRRVEEFPQRLGHKTPAWVRANALFQVRIRTQRLRYPALTEPPLAGLLLAAARRYQEPGHWPCELFLLIPDQLHALLRFPHDQGMTKVVGSWKQGT